jgi:hypothetical protein
VIKRNLAVLVTVVLLGALLVSCGDSKEVASLKVDCARILTNLKSIEKRPKLFDGSSTTVADDSIALLLGTGARKEVERKILDKFPFLDEIIVGEAKNIDYQLRRGYYAGTLYLLAQALTGTKVAIPYSPEEIRYIATHEKLDDRRSITEPLADKIFGNIYEEPLQGCASVEKEKYEKEGYDNKYLTRVAFDRARSNYWDFASMLQVIRNCEVSGWNGTNKCAKVDYVEKDEKDYDWGPPTPTDPFIKRWSDPVQEGLAKFAWCWNQGKYYDKYSDSCY